MTNVGNYEITLTLEDRLTKAMDQATATSDKFTKAVGATTVAQTAQAATAGTSALSMQALNASTALTLSLSLPMAAATANNARMMGRLGGALGEAKYALNELHQPLTTSYLGMNRIGQSAKDLTKEQGSWNRIAAVTVGQASLLGAVFSRLSPRLGEFDRILIEANRARGYRILAFLSTAGIALDRTFQGLTRSVATVFGGIFQGANILRNALGGFGAISETAGRFGERMSQVGTYLRGAFGPFINDLRIVGRIGLRALGPLTNLTARIGAGIGAIASRIVSFRNAAAQVSGLAYRMFQLSAWFEQLAIRFPRFEVAFEKLSKAFRVGGEFVAKIGADIFNKWRRHLNNMLTATRQRLSAIASAVSSGISKTIPYLASFARGVGYVSAEMLKGVATAVKLVSGIGFLGAKILQYSGAVFGAATRTGLLGAHLIRGNGIIGKVVKSLALAALASTGFGGALVANAMGLAAVIKLIPGVDKLSKVIGKALGGALDAAGKVAGFLASKLLLVTTAGMGIGAIAGAGLALLIKSQMTAIGASTKLADKLGIQTDSLIGLQHAAKQAGVSNLDTTLTGLTEKLNSAKADSPLAQALNRTGLSIQHLRSQAPDQVMSTVADAMAGMASEAEKVRLATHLFGEEGIAMVQMLSGGSGGLKAAAADAEKLGMSFTRIDGASIQKANAAMARLQDMFLGIGRQIAIQVAPFVEAFAIKLVDVGTAGGTVGDLVSKGFQLAGQGATWLLDLVDAGINKFMALRIAAADFGSSALSSLSGFLGGAEWMARWIDNGIFGFKALGVGIMTMFAGLFDGIGQLVSMLPSLPDWLGGGQVIDPKVFTGIGDRFRKTADDFQDKLNNHETFSFDGMRAGLDKASKAMLADSAKTGKALEERLAGDGLGKRFNDFMSGIAAEAKARDTKTAEQVAEGAKGVQLAAQDNAEAKEKLAKAMEVPDENEALIRGSAAAFKAEQGKVDALGGISKPGARAVTNAQQKQPVQAKADSKEVAKQTDIQREMAGYLATIAKSGNNSITFVEGTI